MLHLAAEFEIL